MTRCTLTVPRRAGGHRPTAVVSVLLAVLAVLLLGPPGHADTYTTHTTHSAVTVSGAALAGSEPCVDAGHVRESCADAGHVRESSADPGRVSQACADAGHSTVCDTLARSHRDSPGERPAPPATTALAASDSAHAPSPPRTPLSAAETRADKHAADNRQGRAPPPPAAI